ncbi:major facilitator superfamily domain-containing protein [Coniella lustricola]|uniref:Major facilitator superfamily domain-containing protein n=1 Tax=Coniella lustricola TaxID=2025994 RepID=A0A2T2ZU05_9PEZI|nr:major facilitator superfamily domain-containing protein [Coniella lustricola]
MDSDSATDVSAHAATAQHQHQPDPEHQHQDLHKPRSPRHSASSSTATSSSPAQAHDTHDTHDTHDLEALDRTATSRSIAETLPWYRQVLFVAVICLAQLFTQAGLGQILSIIHIVGATWGLANSPDLSWLIAGYSLTVGTFILFSGRLGDIFGYKRMFLIGMAWFSLWSCICGLAVYSSHVLFVFSRVLQGIGPAIILPNGLAILGATYAPGRTKSLAFAAFGGTAPAGSIIGGTFSGLFALAWWPWTFWCFALVLAATVVLGYFVIPDIPTHRPPPRTLADILTRLDVLGALLGVTGLILFNFAWNQAPIAGWDAPYIGVTLALGVLLLAAYLVVEVRFAPEPLVPFAALSSDVAFVLAAVACGWGSFGIWIWYSWEFLLELRAASPLLACAWFSPVVVSGACAAAVVGFLLHIIGPPRVMAGALLAFTVGSVLMATCPIDQTYWAQTFVSFVVTPWGMDMSFPAATLILSNAVARQHQGIAASLVNTVVNYSIALALGVAGTVESRTNPGGAASDKALVLRGYRNAYYLGIGIAALGVCVCVWFIVHHAREERRRKKNENEGSATHAADGQGQEKA